MVIGDSSSRRQATELLAVLTARPRHDANLPGIFGALCPTTKRPMRNEMKEHGKRKSTKERGRNGRDRVCFYATCAARNLIRLTLSERHNYSVIARSLFEERVTRDYNVSFRGNYLAISQLSCFLGDSGRAVAPR